MNIENLARIAINQIRDNWGLPTKGFLAGGSLANLVYNLAHNENAPVNDIDIFILSNESEYSKVLYSFIEKEKEFLLNEYNQLITKINIKDKYTIVDSKIDGIFNYIYYTSKNIDYSIILKSFDLNCTKIGYIIEEDRFLIEDSFIKFIETKSIKIDNINTPGHTAIRLAKKKEELNAFVDKFEYNLLQHTLYYRLDNTSKFGFKEKYKNIYEKYKNILENYFILNEDYDKNNYVKEKYNIDTNIYFLTPKNLNANSESKIFYDDNLNNIYSVNDFLFYMRNIYGNNIKKLLWSKIRHIYNGQDTLNGLNLEQIDLLQKFVTYAPGSIKIFKKLNLKQQVDLIDRVLKYFNYDYEMVILYLENYTNTNIEEIDDFDLTCMDITLRKKKKFIKYKLENIFNF
jgi:hypothetical protein